MNLDGNREVQSQIFIGPTVLVHPQRAKLRGETFAQCRAHRTVGGLKDTAHNIHDGVGSVALQLHQPHFCGRVSVFAIKSFQERCHPVAIGRVQRHHNGIATGNR